MTTHATDAPPETGEAVTITGPDGRSVTLTAAQWGELYADPKRVFGQRQARRQPNEDNRRYTFEADLASMKLGIRKVTEGTGDDKQTYEIPELQVLLKVCDESETEGMRALLTNQRLSPFFARECSLTLEADGVNLSLF